MIGDPEDELVIANNIKTIKEKKAIDNASATSVSGFSVSPIIS